MAAVLDRFYATGRRKTSVARVWIRPGAGRIVVNRRAFEDYFPRETLRMIIAQPLQITNTFGQFDVLATVAGGGPTGQAGAVCQGVARALKTMFGLSTAAAGESEGQIDMGKKLRDSGFLTRDGRMKERKKYGRKGARKSFQFSKR